jgi:hypothetical protein
VNPALAAIAIAILAAAVAAVFARDARVAALSLAAVLTIVPFLADPIAPATGLAARVVGAILATYLLWIPIRDGAFPTGGSRLGWPADGLVAAAAFVVGAASHGLGAPAGGPALASAVGFGLAALAVAPLLTGRDVVRVGIGLSLLLQGALLVRVGLGGTPTVFEELVTAGVTAALGGAIAVLAMTSRTDGTAGFALADELPPRRRRQTDLRPDPRPTAHLEPSSVAPAEDAP